jgi:2-polyprenyl-3-methyl-5-hydroxy-6-metoxy-1,4-benzoquinol methylase
MVAPDAGALVREEGRPVNAIGMPCERDLEEGNMGEMSEASRDHDPAFLKYYEEASASAKTKHRFESVREKIIQLVGEPRPLSVLDIGCGAGTQCRLWAEMGFAVYGVDISASLIRMAEERSAEAGLSIDYYVGSATALPYPDESMDVCLLPELLEHVSDWQSCLKEAIRVLKPDGVLYLSTTNVLCPLQDEFALRAYSWYPAFVKRRYERLAVTTRPDLVSHTRYPALHWFSYYGLRDFLAAHGVLSRDRFDMVDTRNLSLPFRALLQLVRGTAPVRFISHVLTPYTVVFGVKASLGAPRTKAPAQE